MEFEYHTVRQCAHIDLPVDRTCSVGSSGRLHRDPSRCRAGYSALRWHTHPVTRRGGSLRAASRKATNRMGKNRMVKNPKEVSQRVTIRKEASPRVMTRKVDNPWAASRKEVNPTA